MHGHARPVCGVPHDADDPWRAHGRERAHVKFELSLQSDRQWQTMEPGRRRVAEEVFGFEARRQGPAPVPEVIRRSHVDAYPVKRACQIAAERSVVGNTFIDRFGDRERSISQ